MLQLLIRVDAGASIGLGHIMRCLALAQACQSRGGAATFLSAAMPEGLPDRLAREGFQIANIEPGLARDADATVDQARRLRAEWVVVDGYRFGAAHQRALRQAAIPSVFLDDIGHAGTYESEIVLNQNLHASERYYANRAGHTKLLLGPRYQLLRREFLSYRGVARRAGESACILVCPGGSDPHNTTSRVLESLEPLAGRVERVIVVLGNASLHHESVKAQIAASRLPAELLRNVEDMSPLMAAADLAIAFGGSVVWELVFMQVPVIGLDQGPQEAELLKVAGDAGVCLWSGSAGTLSGDALRETVLSLLASRAQRQSIIDRQRLLIDGCGADRVLNEMESYAC